MVEVKVRLLSRSKSRSRSRLRSVSWWTRSRSSSETRSRSKFTVGVVPVLVRCSGPVLNPGHIQTWTETRPRGMALSLLQQIILFLRLSVVVVQGSFPVRKRTGTLRIWRAREREPIWGSGGGAPSGVQGRSPWSGGEAPPRKLKAFYCRREQICHSHLRET